MIGSQGKRICDDAVLRAFDLVHLFGLRLDGHVLMYDADAALSRHGDGHAVLRHSVHSCAHHRNVQFDLLRQPGAELHLVRHHLWVGGYQQHVIKGYPFPDNLSHFLSSYSSSACAPPVPVPSIDFLAIVLP